ncbi:MAG: putative toxin-antitoxin system toxin component, PIN family [Nanoarchaeota archaeon]|nr:putative toxin-antitoxin system toxin component, PIN family [Nanoarchaeota archaeon]MBU1322367.1 putative toxin-antitoxin system toxin component, PIN family [Nanoarchaeota archaeon]MBU1598394.1 putative toxin-antitoxin system toxin component, PIN family [Nanoarchaeota archaeon]MBU2440771.1 putative toxin-antitoxin system toxin component, PIN family [Nanoarchaeota archaeon]
MRVTLDTNVLVSATFWKGYSYEIIRLIDDEKIISLTSHEIIKEYSKVIFSNEIIDKIREKGLIMEKIIGGFMKKSFFIEPKRS